MASANRPGQDTTPSSLLEPGELAALLDLLEEGVLLIEGPCVTFANAALGRMVAETPERLRGRPVRELLADAEGAPLGEPKSRWGARLRTGGGELVPVSVRRAGPRMLLVVDRSRERLLEQEVWHLSRPQLRGEPGEPGETDALLWMMEHEMRTGITVVGGYIRMLLDDLWQPLTGQQREYLEEVRRATDRVETLLNQLLELGPDGTPRDVPVVRKLTSLRELVQNAACAMRPLAEENRVTLTLGLHPDADPLHADPFQLEQVITNLLANALKFSPPGSTVWVETGLDEGDSGEVLWIVVRDEGPGVGAEEADRIFLPLVRGHAAARRGAGGVGLGLAICRRIVRAHGGSIEAVPSGSGGLFRVTLPVDP